jgi:hypothetical protein
MELPNKSRAYVPPKKITDYLLSETHAVGKSKARYFRSFGFNHTTADQLRQGLMSIAQSGQVEEAEKSPFGTKFIVDGELETPKGVMIRVRTIWIIEKGQDNPRFITAYPAE